MCNNVCLDYQTTIFNIHSSTKKEPKLENLICRGEDMKIKANKLGRLLIQY